MKKIKNFVEADELRIIFENTTNEIFVADKDGYCIQANPECERNLGISADQLLGMNVRELIDRGLFTNSTTLKVLELKKPISLMQETITGQKIYATGIPVFDENNEVSRVISTSINITEVLKFQEKAEKMERIIRNYDKELNEIKAHYKLNQGEIVVNNHRMRLIYNLLERIKKVDSTVLLLGESGVGKTEIAQYIHQNSLRTKNKFIEVNCAAIPANLFESELFGYEAGAFSGGLSSGKKGLVHEANNGTLFLDEIGELSLELQPKILHFLQSNTFRRIGSAKTEKSNVRIITATNRDLEKMVEVGEFREDLYYRLSVIPIKIPPLRERKDDMIGLILDILKKLNVAYNCNYRFSNKTIQYLLEHSWPGNIRELKNTIERMCVTSLNEYIDLSAQELKEFITSSKIRNSSTNANTHGYRENNVEALLDLNSNLSLKERVRQFERMLVQGYYSKYNSTQVVANLLKTSQSSVSRKLNEH